MTDSATAIEEAEILHPNYNCLYVKRKRFDGYEGGWESHLAFQDPVAEIVVIVSELMLPEQLYQIVHTSSAFSDEIYSYMTRHRKEIKRIHVSYLAKIGSLPTAPAQKKMLENSFMQTLITDIQSVIEVNCNQSRIQSILYNKTYIVQTI
jgi:Uri superfamily endonuclease